MRFPPEQVQVKCPVCGQTSVMSVYTILDVSENPFLKGLTMINEVNLFHCPKCGAEALMNAPYLYLDTDKELAYMFVPSELNMTEAARQRFIGELMKKVMDVLPPEDRKGYLLHPQLFLSQASLMHNVLEQEGFPPEETQGWEQSTALANKMLALVDDQEALVKFIQEHDQEIDDSLIRLLLNAATGQDAAVQPHPDAAKKGLREASDELIAQLEQHATAGRRFASEKEVMEFIEQKPEPTAIIAKLISLHGEKDKEKLDIFLEDLAPITDYQFLLFVSQNIEMAEKEGDEEKVAIITDLRDRLVQAQEKWEARWQQKMETGSALVEKLLEAQEQGPEALSKEIRRQPITAFNTTFAYVLMSHLKAAKENRLSDLVERLEEIESAITLMRESTMLPTTNPVVEIINRLLKASYPDGTLEMLKELKATNLLTPDFIGLLKAMTEEDKSPISEETRRQLKVIYAQALAVG